MKIVIGYFFSLLSATCGAMEPPEGRLSELTNPTKIRQQLPSWYQNFTDSEILEISSSGLTFDQFEKKHPFNYSYGEERTFAIPNQLEDP